MISLMYGSVFWFRRRIPFRDTISPAKSLHHVAIVESRETRYQDVQGSINTTDWFLSTGAPFSFRSFWCVSIKTEPQLLTKAEINSLYFATHRMERPRGWDGPIPVGRYWRSALVVFFNYGVDTGTVWRSAPFHEPLLWRHVSWSRQSPDREVKEQSRWGWLFYRRVKTGKTFYRPMNRVVHAHIKAIMPESPRLDAPVFLGGGSRPNVRFQELCGLASIKPRANVETSADEPWELKDLRKTCATYYDEHGP